MVYLPEGYKDSTNKTVAGTTKDGTPGPDGTVETIEHWSGRIDARVNAKSVGLKLTQATGAPLSEWHLRAVAEHQKALDELRFARASGRPDWISSCERRISDLKAMILETQ